MHKIQTTEVYCVTLISSVGFVLMHLKGLCRHRTLDTVKQTESAETQPPCVREMAAVQFQPKNQRGANSEGLVLFLLGSTGCCSVKTVDRLEVLADVRCFKSSQWQLLCYYLWF